jgi:hypothetical protein
MATQIKATFIPKNACSVELAARIASAQETVEQFTFYNLRGIEALLNNHAERLAAGQTLSTQMQHMQIDSGNGDYMPVYTKQVDQLANELADVASQVTTKYETEIQADRDEAVQVMAASMIERKRSERAQEQALIDAKELQDAINHATSVMNDAAAQHLQQTVKQAAKKTTNKEF